MLCLLPFWFLPGFDLFPVFFHHKVIDVWHEQQLRLLLVIWWLYFALIWTCRWLSSKYQESSRIIPQQSLGRNNHHCRNNKEDTIKLSIKWCLLYHFAFQSSVFLCCFSSVKNIGCPDFFCCCFELISTFYFLVKYWSLLWMLYFPIHF